MNTIVCDVCGRTQEDLRESGAKIRSYKTSWYDRFFDTRRVTDFDMCDECLIVLQDKLKKEK